MFHLEAGVDLEEIEGPILREEEFRGSRADVAEIGRDLDRGVADLRALDRVQARCRRLLEDLLVPPLHRTLPLAEMAYEAVGVAEQLHLDVPRLRHVALEQKPPVTEGALCRALGRDHGVFEFV